MVVEGDLVATRTTVKAIHTGELLGFAPTHKPIEYNEWFWHRVRDGKIVEGWTQSNVEIVLRRIAAKQ
jgi:predicted ester cyclase